MLRVVLHVAVLLDVLAAGLRLGEHFFGHGVDGEHVLLVKLLGHCTVVVQGDHALGHVAAGLLQGSSSYFTDSVGNLLGWTTWAVDVRWMSTKVGPLT